MEKLRIPSAKRMDTLSPQSIYDFVFVVPSNAAFFPKAVDAIGTIQAHFPNHVILLYDLGGLVDKFSKEVSY